MSQSRGRSVVVGRTVQQAREIDLDALVRRAGEVHATLVAHHRGDVVGVAKVNGSDPSALRRTRSPPVPASRTTSCAPSSSVNVRLSAEPD